MEDAIDSSQGALIPAVCVQFDHIITKGVLDKEEDFKNYINTNTKVECCGHSGISVAISIPLLDPMGHPALRKILCLQLFSFIFTNACTHSVACISGSC